MSSSNKGPAKGGHSVDSGPEHKQRPLSQVQGPVVVVLALLVIIFILIFLVLVGGIHRIDPNNPPHQRRNRGGQVTNVTTTNITATSAVKGNAAALEAVNSSVAATTNRHQRSRPYFLDREGSTETE